MNWTNRRIYSRKYQQLQKAMEVKYSGVVYRALKKQVSEFVADLKQYGIEAARITVRSSMFNEHIWAAIRRLYLDAGMVRASQVRREMRSLKQKRASFGTNDELTHAIIDYLQRHLLDKSVRPISETTRNWILGIISKGVDEGLGADEIAREIEGSEFLRNQADRIVRTEIVRATNIGAMKAAEASPYEVQKEWISAHDNRVRHSHMLIDGQVVDFERRFTNGLLQPGDPDGGPEEVINCRCSVAFVPKRDDQDRLIMKLPGIHTVTPHPSMTVQRPGLIRRILEFLRGTGNLK